MKKRTKRKVYRLIDTMAYVKEGFQVTPKEELDKLRIAELQAIHAFTYGTATIDDWRWLNNMNNIAQNMGRNGVGVEVFIHSIEVERILKEAKARYERTGKMGTTGEGLKLLRELYEYHDLQRTSILRYEYERLIQDTNNRITSRAPEVMEL